MSGCNFIQKPIVVPKVKTKYRKIVTKIPVPETLTVFKSLEKYEARSMHGQLPVVWDKAEDFQVFDKYGNCWIDFTSTIFVTNSGHANAAIISILRKQLDKKLLHTYTFASEIRMHFLKKLIEITPRQFEKAFLLSAGTEATECAVKLMRMHGMRINKGKSVIVSLQGAMHGRTMCAEMLKGDPESSAWVGYLDPNIYNLPFPYFWTGDDKPGYDWGRHFYRDMKKLIDEGLNFKRIAGFILESYLGWGAVFMPVDYVQSLAELAKKYRCLLTFDDIQGGFGRTGKLFAYQHYGVEPDLLCLGKGLTASLPLSAVIGRSSIMDLPEVGSMSSTHSANPLCCAAGLANLDAILDGNLVREAARKGKILHARLRQIKNKFPGRIKYICGKGLLAALIIKNPVDGSPDNIFGSKVCERSMQKGLLLVHTGRESIKIGPPLTIPDEALIEGLNVLEESIGEIDRE